MFEKLTDIFQGRQPLVLREEIRVVSNRLAGCDVLRRDDLGRTVVVVPKGQPVPPDVALTEREEALVYAPAAKRERVMRSSGHGFYFEDVEVA